MMTKEWQGMFESKIETNAMETYDDKRMTGNV